MNPTVSDIMEIMEELAPAELAEKWDNVGLQVGSKNRPVSHVRVALDPLPTVIAAAVADKVDLLITHHPLIFKPISSLDTDTPLGGALAGAISGNLAVFSAHTNLDAALGGVNDVLAGLLGLKDVTPLPPAGRRRRFKLVVFAPESHAEKIKTALFEAGAGRIGAYTRCSFSSTGTGGFLAPEDGRPFLGKPGQAETVDELRIETVLDKENMARALTALRSAHPYETPAHDIYPLEPEAQPFGLGRVGKVEPPLALENFVQKIKTDMGLSHVRFCGRPDLLIKKAAVCSGSGGSLLGRFLSCGADVYVSGDLGYHDARTVEDAGKALVDLGHFETEHPVVAELARRLARAAKAKNLKVEVEAYGRETPVFQIG